MVIAVLKMMKMRATLTIALLLTIIFGYSQHNVNPNTNQVSSFNAQYKFNNVGTYDYDLGRLTGESFRYGVVIFIDISNTGKGRVISYFKEKTVMYVDSCYKKGNNYHFYLDNGRKVILWVNNKNSVYAFTLDNERQNTAIIFFD